MSEDSLVGAIKGQAQKLRDRRQLVIEEIESTEARKIELEAEREAVVAQNKKLRMESEGLRLAINALKIQVPEAFTDELKLTPEA